MIELNEICAVGKFQKTHALKGELNALLDIDPQYITDGNAIVVDTDGIFVPYYASSIREKGATSFLIKLEGIDSEEEARFFVNKTIYAVKSQLGPFLGLEDEEIYDEDNLTGYSVIDNSSGNIIGVVEKIDSTTENILFIVRTDDDETIYIPAVDEFIAEVNDEDNLIKMNLPEGLIHLNAKSQK